MTATAERGWIDPAGSALGKMIEHVGGLGRGLPRIQFMEKRPHVERIIETGCRREADRATFEDIHPFWSDIFVKRVRHLGLLRNI